MNSWATWSGMRKSGIDGRAGGGNPGSKGARIPESGELGSDVGGDLASVEAAVFYEDFAGVHAGYDHSR